MDLIVFNDGLYNLIPITKAMLEHIKIKFTTYVDSLNLHIMNNGSGNFYGCICK